MRTDLIDRDATAELERQIGRARLERVVGIQLAHGRGLIATLDALGASPDPSIVRLLAHQIAGSSGAVGMTALGEAAATLETLALSGTIPDLAPFVQALSQLAADSHDALAASFPKTP